MGASGGARWTMLVGRRAGRERMKRRVIVGQSYQRLQTSRLLPPRLSRPVNGLLAFITNICSRAANDNIDESR
jgi:hypothetical protein